MDSRSTSDNGNVRFPAEDGGKSLAEMAQRDLSATLQLLVERAQYITGATGAAIALRDNFEMVCRASSGSSAPGVGTQLQVDSGLSGESVRTRQTLRCDDAWTDDRVNRESCEALGIRSVVVMPLVRDEEVIGVFELFSDQANVFQPRDIIALERMGAMVHTALEVSAAAFGIRPPVPLEDTTFFNQHGLSGELPRFSSPPDPPSFRPSQAIPMPERAEVAVGSLHRVESTPIPGSPQGITFHRNIPMTGAAAPAMEPSDTPMPTLVSPPAANEDADVLEMPVEEKPFEGKTANQISAAVDPNEDLLGETEAALAESSEPTSVQLIPAEPLPTVRHEVASLSRCEACGFPVSGGRKLCLDCEKRVPPQPAKPETSVATPTSAASAPVTLPETEVPVETPIFLGAADDQASWLSTHKFMVVALVLALIGIVGIVLLR